MNDPTPAQRDQVEKEDDHDKNSAYPMSLIRIAAIVFFMLGALLIFVPVSTNMISHVEALNSAQTLELFLGVGFLVLGSALVVWQNQQEYYLRHKDAVLMNTDDLSLAVEQLARNFELSRSQTNFAFFLTAFFMGMGLAVFMAGAFRSVLGFSDTTKTLTTIVGIFSEFLSGSALLLYRSNFNRLNETSVRLYDTWKIFAAYKLTQDLGEGDRGAATLALISVLAGVAIEKPPVAVESG
jgi:hypothetical protein